jgi:hypothetical protein
MTRRPPTARIKHMLDQRAILPIRRDRCTRASLRTDRWRLIPPSANAAIARLGRREALPGASRGASIVPSLSDAGSDPT